MPASTLTFGDGTDVFIGSLGHGPSGGGTVVIGPTSDPLGLPEHHPRHQHHLLRFVLRLGLARAGQHLDDAHPHRRQQRRQYRHDRRRSHAVRLLRRRAHDRRRRAHRRTASSASPSSAARSRSSMAARCRINAESPGGEHHGDLRTRARRSPWPAITCVGIFAGPATLTISNGGVLNSQGGVEIDGFFEHRERHGDRARIDLDRRRPTACWSAAAATGGVGMLIVATAAR